MNELPPLPDRALLTDLCREAATRERVSPAAVEKDFFLTRLIWRLAQHFRADLLLKGGTLLSKVDLEFHRMSEDVDMVLAHPASSHKRENAKRMDVVRDALRTVVNEVGVKLDFPHGERFDKDAHVRWSLSYPSAFGPQGITMEVTLRPLLKSPRNARLKQMILDPLVGNYERAFCWALAPDEARAEKVRAAFTREAARDFYDLALLLKAGVDMSSAKFIKLVDAKLAELEHPPLARSRVAFELTGSRRALVDASLSKDLPSVVRLGEPPLNLDELLAHFSRLWQVPRRK